MMAQPVLVDLRNIYRPDEMRSAASSMRASAGRGPKVASSPSRMGISRRD